jgi:DNA-binding MarR family transcriptional regulator
MVDSHREQLIEALIRAIYESSTTAVFFHAAIAGRVGLGPTEEKTLLILSGTGPLTAGEIAERTGLTTASVTSLIDRLEQKGFVRRMRDTADRRRVIVEPDETRLAELRQVFTGVQGAFAEVFDMYTDEQLATITDYLSRSTAWSREAMSQLSQHSEGGAKDAVEP